MKGSICLQGASKPRTALDSAGLEST
jgi:hypothetical protein